MKIVCVLASVAHFLRQPRCGAYLSCEFDRSRTAKSLCDSCTVHTSMDWTLGAATTVIPACMNLLVRYHRYDMGTMHHQSAEMLGVEPHLPSNSNFLQLLGSRTLCNVANVCFTKRSSTEEQVMYSKAAQRVRRHAFLSSGCGALSCCLHGFWSLCSVRESEVGGALVHTETSFLSVQISPSVSPAKVSLPALSRSQYRCCRPGVFVS